MELLLIWWYLNMKEIFRAIFEKTVDHRPTKYWGDLVNVWEYLGASGKVSERFSTFRIGLKGLGEF